MSLGLSAQSVTPSSAKSTSTGSLHDDCPSAAPEVAVAFAPAYALPLVAELALYGWLLARTKAATPVSFAHPRER